jgi:hypothetical protein
MVTVAPPASWPSLHVVVMRGDAAGWPESAAHQDVEPTSGVPFGTSRSTSRIGRSRESSYQVRERSAFQDEEWHVRLRHRAGDVRA